MTWRELADELASFVLSGCCAGCDLPGTLLCGACRAELRAHLVHVETPGGMPVVAALGYEGVAARCIRRVKEDGETLLARPLGGALAEACASLGEQHPHAVFVPVPTASAAFRRRGYRVPELLMRHAGARPTRLLRQTGRVRDQRELDVDERRRNVTGSMRARRAEGCAEAIVVDDVVTTGATLDEAARALAETGIRVCGAVALAATPKRREPRSEHIGDRS